MKVADFDFFLPKNLIAKRPLRERDSSRLLVLYRDGMIEHRRFSDLAAYLEPGDMLLMNNTKVFPARLTGYKKNGGILEVLLISEKENNTWNVLSKGKYTGTLKISEELQAVLQDGKTAIFQYSGDFMDIIWKCGDMPLPPYIRRLPDASDKERYQTVYAKEGGSIAAPTAGLHFTERLLQEIITKGIVVREVTLHVGIGTFRPIRSETVEEHSMEPEYFDIHRDIISEIERVKASGKRIVAVGTTTTRAIEGFINGKSNVTAQNGKFRGKTDIFIYPGYNFKIVDSMITNFHLPRSTPLMLVSGLCGWEKLRKSYEEAMMAKYRFFSYGDAMLIL